MNIRGVLWSVLGILYLYFPRIKGVSLSCYKPINNEAINLNNYAEIMVDCSQHGFGTREDLLLHQSKVCQTTASLCDLITGFDYSYNNIRHLAKPRYEFKLINKLIFKHNLINFIEDDAFNGENLKLLDLSHNNLEGGTLRKNIFRGKYEDSTRLFQDSSIEKLFLGGNNIEYVDYDAFFYLRKLKVLELNNNPISVIGDSTIKELQRLPMLYVLHLGTTNITRIPDNMFSNMKIETLSLNGNKFTEVPNLKELSNYLTNLNIDSNELNEINDGSFQNLIYLTTLNMSSNYNLKTIRRNSFRHLMNLQILYCNYNPVLSYIHPAAFNSDWNLKEFYLNNNALTSLPHELGDWESLDLLEIQSNPWTCDCSMQWLIDYVAQRQRTEPELNYNLHCEGPTKFRGVHLLSNNVLSYLSRDCDKGTLPFQKIYEEIYKLYPLLFVTILLVFFMLTYLIIWSYRYFKTNVPYVCNYTVQYNKLNT